MIKKFLQQIFFYNTLIVSGLSLNYCANPGTLSGGDKDTVPPQMLASSPPNETLFFTGNKIELVFNEYINFKSSSNSVLISPPITPEPTYTVKGKSLIINLPDDLKANTTYSFNFSSSISDYTEGNVLSQTMYILSTGSYIDSLTLSGAVVDGNTLDPSTAMSVYLYPNDVPILDSVQPLYQIQTDESGNFRFEHLKEGDYKLAVLNDKNANRKAELSTEEIGFLQESITLKSSFILSEPIRMFPNFEELKLIKAKKVEHGKLSFAFNKPVEQIMIQNSLEQNMDRAYFNETKDTLTYWYSANEGIANFYLELDGSIKDTAEVNLESRNYKERNKIVKLSKEIPANESFDIKYNAPISSVESSLIKVLDSKGNPVLAEMYMDRETLSVQTKWQKDSTYVLVLEEGAITNFRGIASKRDSISFYVLEEDVYPTLSLTSKEIPANSLVLLMGSTNRIIAQEYFIEDNVLTFKNLKPDIYSVKVIGDENGNGKWDTGNLLKGQQAERVLNYTKDIEIKSNWDKELDILLK